MSSPNRTQPVRPTVRTAVFELRPVMHERSPIYESGTFYETCCGGHGVAARHVETAPVRREALREALAAPGPMLLEVEVA